MSQERRAVWAHGLRKLRIQKAIQRDRKAVQTITEALRDPDAVDLVGDFVFAKNPAWGALGDGKFLDILGKIGEWFLEHGDEILALLLKLIALKSEEDAALAALASRPAEETVVEAGGAAISGVGVLLALFLVGVVALVSSARPAAGQAVEITRYASVEPGASVFEFVSPAGESVCVGPNCRRPVASMLDVLAPRVSVAPAVVSDVGFGSTGSPFASPSGVTSGHTHVTRPAYRRTSTSVGYGSTGTPQSRPRPIRRLWR